MLQRFLLITLTLFSLSATAQWQQTGSKVRYVNGLGIPTKDTAAGVSADSSQILIRPADSSLYVKYKRTWLRVGGGGGSIAGSGTTNYIPKFTSATALGNSQIFDNGTNVGIGTASPARKLTVSGSAGNSMIALENIGIDYYGIGMPSGTGDMAFYASATTERMRITSAGNVGIGYTAPAAKLAVSGTTLINTNTDNGVDKLQVSGSMNVSTLATTNNLSVTTNATVGGTATIQGNTYINGNVGINNGSPYNSFIIDKNTNAPHVLAVRNLSTGTGANASISIANSTGLGLDSYILSTTATGTTFGLSNSNLVVQQVQSTGSSYIINIGNTTGSMVFGTNTTERMRILPSGRILANTTTDNTVDQLQVNGSILSTQYKLSALNTAPATASSTGTLGEIRIDANYIYICTATNTWKRAAIATW